MSKTTFVNRAFDPNVCPLLKGLSPEEQQERMRNDPLIRRCVEGVESAEDHIVDCKAAKAYLARKAAEEKEDGLARSA